MLLRSLTPDDEPQLVIFSCAGGGRQAWSHGIERMVREYLTLELVRGTARAVGWFDDETQRLVALVAWQIGAIPYTWHVPTLAVATGFRRHHLGMWAKRELLRRAHAEQIGSVYSVVHRDNIGMLRINQHLGARSTGESSAYNDHVELAITVRPEHAYSWAPVMRCPEHGDVRTVTAALLPTCPGPVGVTRAGLPTTEECLATLAMPSAYRIE